MKGTCFLGLDVGTSGCRAAAIDAGGEVLAILRRDWPDGEQQPLRHPAVWWQTARQVLAELAGQLDRRPVALAVDGTSGTVLLCASDGTPVTEALPYNDTRASQEAAAIRAVAPRECAAHGSGSGLAKALYLLARSEIKGLRAANQAEWVAGRLRGAAPVADENNALKLGFDPVARCWPGWLDSLGLPAGFLPEVVPAGTPLGPVDAGVAKALGLPPDLRIVAGTTDSTAGFLAAGDPRPGTAVTALGSTLAVKTVASAPVFAPDFGVYSHRLGDLWLAGGASNSGGGVLAQHFSTAELERLTPLLDPSHDTGLDYYPLPDVGERFPVADPALTPRLSPRPDAPEQFLQGLLEGIARIEAEGYRRLAELGAPYPQRVITTGGGARNPAWQTIRARYLGVDVSMAAQEEAAVGTAFLARQGTQARQ